MSFEDLKREALKLSRDERADLAQTLIQSLDEIEQEEDREEIERLWAEEAERRYQEFLDGKVEAIPAEEALRRVRAALR